MATSGGVMLPSSFNNKDLRLLPEGGQEVPAILVLTKDRQTHAIGAAKDDVGNPASVMVRLGSKVGDNHPSSVGFRVLLRTDTPRTPSSCSIDDHYHVVSCRFDPESGNLTHSKVSPDEKKELMKIRPFRKEELRVEPDQDLYQIDFHVVDTNAFSIHRCKPDFNSTNGHVNEIQKMVPFISYATKLSLVFIADKLLVQCLTETVKRGCVGDHAPDWRSGLPNDALTIWPSNIQTQMVRGSTDVLNIILSASRDQPMYDKKENTDGINLADGAGTAVQDRLEAVKFKEHVRKTYPNARQEPESKLYPVLLNVPGFGNCVELPFGAAMLNRKNTYAGIEALHALLDSGIPASRIGIVTLYPAQSKAYKDALDRCEKCDEKRDDSHGRSRGYKDVQCDILENWVGKTVGIAIIDLVRTSNATGNLGFLSQANRLKVMLSLHENGFIVIGDRACTTTPHGTVTSTKLEKVLQWFEDHGRIVQISDKNKPCPKVSVDANVTETASIPMDRVPSVDSTAPLSRTTSVSGSGTNQRPRRYVGVPGLEHLRINKPMKEDARVKFGRTSEGQDRVPASASHVKHSLTKSSLPSTKSKRHVDDAPSTITTLNYDESEDVARPDPYTSSLANQEISSSLDTQSIAKNIQKALETHHASKEKKLSQTPNVFGEEISPGEGKDASATTQTPASMTYPPSVLPQRNRAPGVPSSPASPFPLRDSVLISYNMNKSEERETARKGLGLPMNEGPDEVNSQKKNSTLITPAMYLANSAQSASAGRVPPTSVKKENVVPSTVRPQSTQVAKPVNGIVAGRKSDIMSENMANLNLKDAFAKKESNQLQNVTKPVQAPIPSIKIEPASLETPDTKAPPHKAVPKITGVDAAKKVELPIQSSSTTAAKVQSPVKESFPSLIPQPPAKTPSMEIHQTVPVEAANTTSMLQVPKPMTKPAKQTPSAVTSNTSELEDEGPDFTATNRPKYRALRARFAAFDPKLPRVQPKEDRLFRRLAEALVDEDEDEFERVYNELLGMATRLQTSALKRA